MLKNFKKIIKIGRKMTKFWIFEVDTNFKKIIENLGVTFLGSQKLGGTKFFSKKNFGVKHFFIRKILFKFLFKLVANKNYNKFDGSQIFFKNTKF